MKSQFVECNGTESVYKNIPQNSLSNTAANLIIKRLYTEPQSISQSFPNHQFFDCLAHRDPPDEKTSSMFCDTKEQRKKTKYSQRARMVGIPLTQMPSESQRPFNPTREDCRLAHTLNNSDQRSPEKISQTVERSLFKKLQKRNVLYRSSEIFSMQNEAAPFHENIPRETAFMKEKDLDSVSSSLSPRRTYGKGRAILAMGTPPKRESRSKKGSLYPNNREHDMRSPDHLNGQRRLFCSDVLPRDDFFGISDGFDKSSYTGDLKQSSISFAQATSPQRKLSALIPESPSLSFKKQTFGLDEDDF